MSVADFQFGGLALSVFMAVAAVGVLIALGTFALRKAGPMGGVLWGGALVLVGVVAALIVSDRSSGEHNAERRAIEARAAELTARAISPGSALACLDAIANAEVETACEKTLFASPETVAVALTYIDARLSLLASSMALAERDSSYRPPLERMRRAIEDDYFGLAAQVMTTRGCTPTRCLEFALLKNTTRIVSNMQARTFDVRVGLHAAAWANGAALAATPPPSSPPSMASTVPGGPAGLASMPPPVLPIATAASPAAPPPKGIDFPSAASIPPVSIMSAEPANSPQAEPRPAAAPPPRRPPPQIQQSRRQQREAASPPPAAPPLSVVPQQLPPPPQTSGSR
jgi:hypothetical protein